MKHLWKAGSLIIGVLLLTAFIFPEILIEAGVTGAFALGIFTRVCGKNVSGVQKIFIAEKSVVTAITVTSGEISAITGTTPFMRVDIEQDSGEWEQEDSKVGQNNTMIKNTVRALIAKTTKDMNTFIDALITASPCGLYAIVTDGNGQNWLVGYDSTALTSRPLRYLSGKQKTGKQPSDADGQTKLIELGNETFGLALPFDTTLNAAINGMTSTIIKWS